jgi:hypothetical protein
MFDAGTRTFSNTTSDVAVRRVVVARTPASDAAIVHAGRVRRAPGSSTAADAGRRCPGRSCP